MPTHTFMELALDEAYAAADAGEVPIGCVIVCDGDLIAQAGNRTLAERDPTAHAEMVAIRRAAEALGRHVLAPAGGLWRHRRDRGCGAAAPIFCRAPLNAGLYSVGGPNPFRVCGCVSLVEVRRAPSNKVTLHGCLNRIRQTPESRRNS